MHSSTLHNFFSLSYNFGSVEIRTPRLWDVIRSDVNKVYVKLLTVAMVVQRMLLFQCRYT